MWDVGADSAGLVPGLPSHNLRFWDEVILRGQCTPTARTVFSFLRDRVGLTCCCRSSVVLWSISRLIPIGFGGGLFSPTACRRRSATLLKRKSTRCRPRGAVQSGTYHCCWFHRVPAPVTSEPAVRTYSQYIRSSVCINAALSFDIITSVQVGKLSVRHPGSVSAKNTFVR